ncbi:hypothetical protein EBR66_08110, partial [bacterium]|nr:hypothetical protein [bacterium]
AAEQPKKFPLLSFRFAAEGSGEEPDKMRGNFLVLPARFSAWRGAPPGTRSVLCWVKATAHAARAQVSPRWC